jgi:regulatory protein
MAAGKPLSLKARAIALLAQREHSMAELRRKLLRIAQQRDRAAVEMGMKAGAADQDGHCDLDDTLDPAARQAEVEQLLSWLQAQGYLNEERFVESRLHLRARRFGSLRIKQELAQHGLALSSEQAQGLREAELPRAMEIRQRKFGEALPADAAARAKQARFLAARGFSADVIRKALKEHD